MNFNPVHDWSLRVHAQQSAGHVIERIKGHLTRLSGSIVCCLSSPTMSVSNNLQPSFLLMVFLIPLLVSGPGVIIATTSLNSFWRFGEPILMSKLQQVYSLK